MRHQVWFGELQNLRKRAIRARVWHKVEIGHRATIGLLQWIASRGERELLNRIIRNRVLNEMIDSAARIIIETINSHRLSFQAKAFLHGKKISKNKIEIYRENGVLYWAPWVEGWLRRREYILFLGTMSIGMGACAD